MNEQGVGNEQGASGRNRRAPRVEGGEGRKHVRVVPAEEGALSEPEGRGAAVASVKKMCIMFMLERTRLLTTAMYFQ